MMAPSRGSSAPQEAALLQDSSSSSTGRCGPWLALLLLWWAGFKDACRFRRVYDICKRSHTVRIKTGQCFLNGSIVLGSVLTLEKVMIPILSWLLNFQSQVNSETDAGDGEISGLQSFLVAVYYVFWLYPIYVISFIVNCIRSNEIAQHAFKVVKEADSSTPSPSCQDAHQSSTSKSPKGAASTVTAIDGFALGIGEQLYSVIVISAFFAEAVIASFIPYVGQLLYFLLLSWLYAYYCFEYKWGFARWSLERRLVFFESNWAFFSGFGSPCVLATFFFSPLVSTGVTAILYPLFVLIATASNPEHLIAAVQCDSSVKLPRLPIFYLANTLTLPMLRLLHKKFPSMRKESASK